MTPSPESPAPASGLQAKLEEIWSNNPLAGDAMFQAFALGQASMQAELAALKEQVRWRPYPAESPTQRGWYLVAWDVDGESEVNRELFSDSWVTFHSDYRTMLAWMPLPAPDAKEGK